MLAQNNIYSDDVTIATQADLDFATALGDKVGIINGDLTITQPANMNAEQLATLMGKVASVTGNVTYTATISSTTAGVFTKLNGSNNLTISQSGDISLPAYVQAGGTLSVTGDELTTSVSLASLKSAATLAFAGISKATSFSMPSMVEYDNDLTITIDKTGTVDLSSFKNDTTGAAQTAETTATADKLTVTAGTLVAPVYALGEIDADELTSVDLPKWAYKTGSSFAKAKTVVLPSVNPGKVAGASIAINTVFPNAESVHIIAAASTVASVDADDHTNVSTSSTKLETLILGGTFTTVNISAGSDLTSLTFDGTAKSVTVDGTDIETLDIPYTTAAKGTLVVQNNSKLTAIHADKIDGLSALTITSNADLAEISFDALESAAATGATVAISGNDLMVESVSDAQTSPVVAKKIVSADFAVLKAFLADAIDKVTSTSGTQVMVSVDTADVDRAYDSAGDERNVASTDAVLANVDYVASDATDSISKVEEVYFTALTGDATFQVDGSSVSIIDQTGLDIYYDIAAWASSASTATQLSAAGVEITGFGKGQRTAEIDFNGISNVSSVFTVAAGTGEAISVTTGSASTTTELAAALKGAFTTQNAVVSKYFTVATATGDKLVFSSNAKGSHRQTFNLSVAGQVLSGTVGATSISFSSASISTDNLIESTDQAYVTFKSTTAGLDGAKTITVVNNNVAQLLAASGVDTTKVGDDETFTAAVDGTTATNAAAVAAAAINNVQYIQ